MKQLFAALAGLLAVLPDLLKGGRPRNARRRGEARWSEAAAALGLIDSASFDHAGLEGAIRGVPVFVAELTNDSGITRLSYRAAGRFPEDLSIGAEGLGSKLSKLAGERDIEVGDPAFDRTVLIRGPRAAVVGALAAPLREKLVAAVSQGRRVEKGEVLLDTGGGGDAAVIVANVRACVGLAEELARAFAADPAEGLIANTAGEQIPAVRRRNLELLLEFYPGEPAAKGLRTALGDPLAETRRFAAEQILSRPDGAGLQAAARLTLEELSRTGAGQLSLSAPGAEGAVSIAGEAGAVSIAVPEKKS